ncbi:hypothetical protein [Pseudomonas phage IR-QUMS-PaBa1-GHS-2021]|uniref:hypothetical protein n=1 Tax=Pseudomonas aeruginosa TaxID=287 RepID=UPI001BD292DA|nr:hypothetical protein [Pseudomonas aeruginosa]MBS9730347.1 hypothetical protein [Pseudomonas aeruginosa]UZV40009.1 hypothetical protein [Pseudomonas phage IR-QUMS-PaBa1-GHS-2021]
MIFKYPNGLPFELYVVTGELVDTLVAQSIPLSGLKEISAYHDKITFGEMANFVALQYAAAKVFGVEMPDPTAYFGHGYNAGMVAEAFNGVDSDAIATLLRTANHFRSTVNGQVILIGVEVGDHKATASWEKLQAKTISTAVLETLYARVGYLESHFGPVPKAGLGELTLAEVFKLIHLQNP